MIVIFALKASSKEIASLAECVGALSAQECLYEGDRDNELECGHLVLEIDKCIFIVLFSQSEFSHWL